MKIGTAASWEIGRRKGHRYFLKFSVEDLAYEDAVRLKRCMDEGRTLEVSAGPPGKIDHVEFVFKDLRA